MNRIKVYQIIIYIIAAAVILRLFYWQFLSDIPKNASADTEGKIPASRGEIYASDGFPIATNQESFLIFAKPHEIKEPKNVAKKLAPLLISEKYATREASLSEDEEKAKKEEIGKIEENLGERLTPGSLYWVQLKRKVPLSVKQKLEAANIEGLGYQSDEKRFYPEGTMAAQLLGFVGSDKFGDDVGYFGLEGFWDQDLKGKPGRLGQETDPLGFPILTGIYRPIAPKKGSSIFTNIDRTIQFKVENELKRSTELYGAKSGTVIVSEPSTGKILAMATYPSYNPSLYAEFGEDLYKNPAVADTYEPGSTFKLVTMAAAFDTGTVEPVTKCNVCSGPRQIGGFEISTWNKKYYPDSTMTEVIEHSDNVGMTFVSEKLGLDKFYEYITKFGFGQKTDIDLQEESTGAVRNKKEWKVIDLATASFGQGIAVTPIQMIQAVGAIANNGKLVSPTVADRLDESGKVTYIKPKETKQVISPKTAVQITEMMVSAVEKGEARAFAPKGYRIAGKTGTAQIPLAGHYDPNKTITSFIGFAPANDPKFVMLVRFTEPSSSPFGSETAAPTFFKIASELFNYYNIPRSE